MPHLIYQMWSDVKLTEFSYLSAIAWMPECFVHFCVNLKGWHQCLITKTCVQFHHSLSLEALITTNWKCWSQCLQCLLWDILTFCDTWMSGPVETVELNAPIGQLIDDSSSSDSCQVEPLVCYRNPEPNRGPVTVKYKRIALQSLNNTNIWT